jgi:enoyl-CoA hydratase/carnithine racemase
MAAVLETEFPQTSNIHLNRPSSLNCLSFDTVLQLRSIINNRHKTLVFTGEGRAFCAGGDVVGIYQRKFSAEEFFFNEFNLFFEISCMSQDRISILDGITMGGGAGLSMSCSHQVLTNKTLWAMPETAIGHVIDVGSSYFLNHLYSEEVGLYLGLTGSRLTGIDCYYAGISNLYVPQMSSSIKSQILNEGTQGLLRNCITPESSESQLLRDLPLISQCFNINFDVESICNRLSSVNTEWSSKVLENLKEMCPLSLKLVHEMVKRGKNLSYFQALEMEYNVILKMKKHRQFNFNLAIAKKLIQKKKEKIEWNPANLFDISDQKIQEFFENHEHKLINHKL